MREQIPFGTPAAFGPQARASLTAGGQAIRVCVVSQRGGGVLFTGRYPDSSRGPFASRAVAKRRGVLAHARGNSALAGPTEMELAGLEATTSCKREVRPGAVYLIWVGRGYIAPADGERRGRTFFHGSLGVAPVRCLSEIE